MTTAPSAIDLGTHRQGASSPAGRITISNTGNVPYELQLLSVAGYTQPTGYHDLLTYQFNIKNIDCPVVLAVNKSCTFEIIFSSLGNPPFMITPPFIPETPPYEKIQSQVSIGKSKKVPVSASVKLMNVDTKACIQVGSKKGSSPEFDSKTIKNVCDKTIYVNWCHAPSSRPGTQSGVCGYKGGILYFGYSTALDPGKTNDNFYTLPPDAALYYGACSANYMRQLGGGKYECLKP